MDEGVEIYRALAHDNPAFLPGLAGALGNLVACYFEGARSQEAVVISEETVEIFRALARDNPAFLPDVAKALNNLGASYLEVGRPLDAVAAAEEAVETYRPLAWDNPAFLSDLPKALKNLSNTYSAAGLHQKAIAPAEETVAVCLTLAQQDQAGALGHLAMALDHLGIHYREVGREAEIQATWEQASVGLSTEDRQILHFLRSKL